MANMNKNTNIYVHVPTKQNTIIMTGTKISSHYAVTMISENIVNKACDNDDYYVESNTKSCIVSFRKSSNANFNDEENVTGIKLTFTRMKLSGKHKIIHIFPSKIPDKKFIDSSIIDIFYDQSDNIGNVWNSIVENKNKGSHESHESHESQESQEQIEFESSDDDENMPELEIDTGEVLETEEINNCVYYGTDNLILSENTNELEQSDCINSEIATDIEPENNTANSVSNENTSYKNVSDFENSDTSTYTLVGIETSCPEHKCSYTTADKTNELLKIEELARQTELNNFYDDINSINLRILKYANKCFCGCMAFYFDKKKINNGIVCCRFCNHKFHNHYGIPE